MLPLHHRIVADDHIPMPQMIGAIDLEPRAYGHADGIRHEDGHSPAILRHQLALRVEQADGVVLVFVDEGAEGGARDVRVDLVGGGDHAPADDFK